VNSRTKITRHGGYEDPKVTAYKWQCKECWRAAWRDKEAIEQARDAKSWLYVSLHIWLPANKMDIRDVDNMLQVPINALKEEIGIDDARIADLYPRKRLAPRGIDPSLLISVMEMSLEELEQDIFPDRTA
jgi:Holliday junction resolvase RusA-like endonuclease